VIEEPVRRQVDDKLQVEFFSPRAKVLGEFFVPTNGLNGAEEEAEELLFHFGPDLRYS
jgi:hypothetical protein